MKTEKHFSPRRKKKTTHKYSSEMGSPLAYMEKMPDKSDNRPEKIEEFFSGVMLGFTQKRTIH